MNTEDIRDIIEEALEILAELDRIATVDEARRLLRNLYLSE